MRVSGDCSTLFGNFPAARLVFEIQDGLNLVRAICVIDSPQGSLAVD